MKTNKFKKHFKKAFTLVELIIVIAVIAILAVFLIPNFSNVLGDTQVTQVKNDTKQIQQVVQAYINQTGAVPVYNSNTANALPNEMGISRAEFQAQAAAGTYYAIDMTSLTVAHTNIDDGLTKVSPMITSVPATSAIKDVNTANTYVSSKNVKNTSVVYVIDKDLNVYATWCKAVKKTNAQGVALPANGFRVFNTNDANKTDATFKMEYKESVPVVLALNANDSNYK